MATIRLTEHQDSEPAELTIDERDKLIALLPNATIRPTPGSNNSYIINPGHHIGLINTGTQIVHIEPKIGIERTLFLLAYALDPKHWAPEHVPAQSDLFINEAIAIPFIHHTRNAIRRHVLHGYRTIDDTLHGIKGRIRFSDQLRRHQRLAVPVEVTYDEHTPDIIENQLLLAALHRIQRLRRLPTSLQHDISQLTHTLHNVTHHHFDQNHTPTVTITRLNKHYAPALTLARLILTNRTLELDTGIAASESLLFNMATVFETFVHTALREALQLTDRQFPRANRQHLHLDTAERVKLKPDISWWESSTCTLVGDIKYKQTISGDGNNADLYQALAYAHATQLNNATLIYAHTENTTATHNTISGTRIHVEALHLNGTPTDILNEIKEIAQRLTERRQPVALQHAS